MGTVERRTCSETHADLSSCAAQYRLPTRDSTFNSQTRRDTDIMASGKVLIVSIALLAAILQTATASVMFAPCQISTKGTVTNIDITGCNDKSPCKLIRGTNSTIAITFSTTGTAQKLEAVVHGVIAGLPVPFNLPNPDACTTGGLTCPIQTNTQLTYTNSLPILKVYPRIAVQVKWELKDEDENDVFCVLIPVQLK